MDEENASVRLVTVEDVRRFTRKARSLQKKGMPRQLSGHEALKIIDMAHKKGREECGRKQNGV